MLGSNANLSSAAASSASILEGTEASSVKIFTKSAFVGNNVAGHGIEIAVIFNQY
jgi:hypothetical protein